MNRYNILRRIVWKSEQLDQKSRKLLQKRRRHMANVQLLIIDGQNDFCDPKGALVVPGADKDMERLAQMIVDKKEKIDDITVTLDSHRFLHIAHPIWWKDAAGNHPAPFTIINMADVEGTNPKWQAFNPGFQKRSVEYVKALSGTKYPLCIWPPHCLIGSWGHGVYPVLFKALQEWEKRFSVVDYVTKGSNMFTEHYSAVKAEVPDPDDHTTLINTPFVKKLQGADILAIAGEALSHCVANTVRNVNTEFGSDQARKFHILKNASSAVPGFENLADDFVNEMQRLGAQIVTTADFLA